MALTAPPGAQAIATTLTETAISLIAELIPEDAFQHLTHRSAGQPGKQKSPVHRQAPCPSGLAALLRLVFGAFGTRRHPAIPQCLFWKARCNGTACLYQPDGTGLAKSSRGLSSCSSKQTLQPKGTRTETKPGTKPSRGQHKKTESPPSMMDGGLFIHGLCREG